LVTDYVARFVIHFVYVYSRFSLYCQRLLTKS